MFKISHRRKPTYANELGSKLIRVTDSATAEGHVMFKAALATKEVWQLSNNTPEKPN